ncbi:polymerase [Mesorhizobium sp. 131-2-5]|uniref:polymerase n=1 Tax=Mesorhizobium sp. 131-2-5 TaxID=2744519 RepID=UPI001928C275|nr:polymerase [Mesorhizobium sp. 131-2-5]
MQFGELIANMFAAVLLLGLLAIGFFIFGKPVWPERTARMVIILPVDAMKTAAINTTRLHLPANFEVGLVQPRPSR